MPRDLTVEMVKLIAKVNFWTGPNLRVKTGLEAEEEAEVASGGRGGWQKCRQSWWDRGQGGLRESEEALQGGRRRRSYHKPQGE